MLFIFVLQWKKVLDYCHSLLNICELRIMIRIIDFIQWLFQHDDQNVDYSFIEQALVIELFKWDYSAYNSNMQFQIKTLTSKTRLAPGIDDLFHLWDFQQCIEYIFQCFVNLFGLYAPYFIWKLALLIILRCYLHKSRCIELDHVWTTWYIIDTLCRIWKWFERLVR